jgi:hypothetical protein
LTALAHRPWIIAVRTKRAPAVRRADRAVLRTALFTGLTAADRRAAREVTGTTRRLCSG